MIRPLRLPHPLPTLLIAAAGALVGLGAAAQAHAGHAGLATPESAQVAPADSVMVATAGEAIAIALGFVRGGNGPADGVDALLGGASARDTGRYWIVTVTRDGLTVLNRPRIIAVDKFTGRARDLLEGEHGEDHLEDHDPRDPDDPPDSP